MKVCVLAANAFKSICFQSLHVDIRNLVDSVLGIALEVKLLHKHLLDGKDTLVFKISTEYRYTSGWSTDLKKN